MVIHGRSQQGLLPLADTNQPVIAGRMADLQVQELVGLHFPVVMGRLDLSN